LEPRGRAVAIDILEQLLHFFEGFGPVGLVTFLFLVLFADAMLVPTLPELFVMTFYSSNPHFWWGVLLLAVVCTAEVSSNATLYLVVKRYGLPARLERRMKQWVNFLPVRDERAILMNRVAPVVPFMGAFIATMHWDPRRSLLYVFLGALVKYSLLLVLVDVLFEVFEGTTARNFTLVAIVVVVGVSYIQSHYHKRKRLGPIAAKVAHLGDRGKAGEAPTAGEAGGSVPAVPAAAPAGKDRHDDDPDAHDRQ
jgi:hypothetical protein